MSFEFYQMEDRNGWRYLRMALAHQWNTPLRALDGGIPFAPGIENENKPFTSYPAIVPADLMLLQAILH